MTDSDCGKEVLHYDFSEPEADSFGEIMYLDGINPFLGFRKNSDPIAHSIPVPSQADLIEVGKTIDDCIEDTTHPFVLLTKVPLL